MNYKANTYNAHDIYNHANETKSHAEQIIMLYIAAISYVRQAKEAAENNDHNTRYQLIDKTISIMRGLRACLDFGANPQVANALNEYYEALDNLLIAVQCEDNKVEICDKIIENLRVIKEAWEGVEVTSDGGSGSGSEV